MPHSTDVDPESRRGINDALASRHVDLLHTPFPHLQRLADELLDRSKTSRDLVEEYGMCSEALDRISREGPSTLLLEQYTSLRFGLERAPLQCLADQRRNNDLC